MKGDIGHPIQPAQLSAVARPSVLSQTDVALSAIPEAIEEANSEINNNKPGSQIECCALGDLRDVEAVSFLQRRSELFAQVRARQNAAAVPSLRQVQWCNAFAVETGAAGAEVSGLVALPF